MGTKRGLDINWLNLVLDACFSCGIDFITSSKEEFQDVITMVICASR